MFGGLEQNGCQHELPMEPLLKRWPYFFHFPILLLHKLFDSIAAYEVKLFVGLGDKKIITILALPKIQIKNGSSKFLKFLKNGLMGVT